MQTRLPLDQLLFDTTFVVVDLETTGLRPGADRITEIGAVKTCRGDRIGEFATLVHPGRPVPAAITSLTGITDHLLRGAPPIEAVLEPFLEFVRGAVLVAHNARFDIGFLNAELRLHGWPRLDNPVVDTAALARRLLRDEVRSLRLSVLAAHLRARTSPNHRALPDARATVDVFHGLVERAGSLGATTVEDLQDLCRSSSDRAFRKIDLVRGAPSRPGVYRFRDERGEVLYVGTSTDLRRRLRSYFGQDRRRRIADMVRETVAVDWTVTPCAIEAAVRELREIHASSPRYNRRSRRPPKPAWIKLTREPMPRLSVVAAPSDPRCFHIGPLRSRRLADQLATALAEAAGLRPCKGRLRASQDNPPCILKELGTCAAPCDGTLTLTGYDQLVEDFRQAVATDPGSLLAALEEPMLGAAAGQRFEAARAARERVHLVARTLLRLRRRASLRAVDRLVAVRPSPAGAEAVAISRGRLLTTAVGERDDDDHVLRLVEAVDEPLPELGVDASDEEVDLLLQWLDQPDVRVVSVTGTWDEPVDSRPLVVRAHRAERLARQLRRDEQVLTGTKTVSRAA
ncbi:MAG: DEDD exonuclease domain-containing protein [Nitriliruptorales bacterium]|nr:DEDD exonuclease domain-containing protein [Nitriliruptorales bacterium]